MPTGYTADVCDGKVTKFKDFAMQCARAFGACVELRDEPMDAPIPEKFEASSYHSERLAEARDRLGELTAMTPNEADTAAATAYEMGCASSDECNARYDAENARVDAMIKEVESWTPPTPEHFEMKNFMLQQLGISKSNYRSEPPPRLSGSEWLAAEIVKTKRDVEYHANERDAEVKHAAGRTAWLQALRVSLAEIPGAEGR